MTALAGDFNLATGTASTASGTFAADGSSTGFVLTSRVPFRLDVWGTFGSGTAKPQYSPNGGTTWIDYKASITGETVTLTADGGIAILNACQGDLWRVNLNGSTNPTLTYRFMEMLRK